MAGRGRRHALIAVGAVVLVLAAVAAVVLFIFRDRATPVAAGNIDVTLVTGAGRPGDFGRYTYATTGFETTDALTGSRHDYPAQTFLTIQPGGCGTLVRWQALEERWDEWDYCAGEALAGRQNYHEWFSVGNLEAWVCAPPVPASGEPGEAWTGDCTRPAGPNVEAAAETLALEVIGLEILDVGGRAVETLHVRETTRGHGGSETEDTTDTWFLPGTFLVVRRVAVGSSVSESRIGPVRYHEEYEIHLMSLSPES